MYLVQKLGQIGLLFTRNHSGTDVEQIQTGHAFLQVQFGFLWNSSRMALCKQEPNWCGLVSNGNGLVPCKQRNMKTKVNLSITDGHDFSTCYQLLSTLHWSLPCLPPRNWHFYRKANLYSGAPIKGSLYILYVDVIELACSVRTGQIPYFPVYKSTF